jgi:capsid protein
MAFTAGEESSRMSDPATRLVQPLPAGTGFSRFLRCLVAGRGSLADSLELAETMRSTPQVKAAFEYMTKAAQSAGTTTDPAWLGPLATTGLATEALSLLRGLSIVGALDGKVRRIPFQMKVPRDTSAVTVGGWIAENTPIPAAQLSFDNVGPVSIAKVGVIVALSRELLLTGSPATEAIVRASVLGGLAVQIDRSFLDPTSGAVAGRPAAITSGAIAVTSTGSTATAMTTDLNTMIGSVDDQRGLTGLDHAPDDARPTGRDDRCGREPGRGRSAADAVFDPDHHQLEQSAADHARRRAGDPARRRRRVRRQRQRTRERADELHAR